VEVLHFLPGRLRLKLRPRQSSHLNFEQIAHCLEGLPWINSFRLNSWAASVVVHYGESNAITTLEATPVPKTPKAIAASPPVSLVQKIGYSSLTLPLVATGFALWANRWPEFKPLARLALFWAGFPVARRAFVSIVGENRLNIDCLDLLALVFSSVQGKLLTPALVITLHELGDLIREQTARSTEKTTANLLDTIGRTAWVERDGQILQIASDQVQMGETVVVYPGERIPVDGLVLSGEATVDQQQLTGESMPIVAIADSVVYAATLIRSGQLRIRCERVGNQTRAAASIELLTKAPVHDTRMANYAAQLADKLIVPSLVLATVVYATTQDPTRTASILTLDFVTGIRVSLPTALLGALNHITRHGVIVRSGRTLELLADVDTVVFDKTGTLTQGNIKVGSVVSIDPHCSPDQLLQWAASAEQRITHPVAEAIVNEAQQQGITLWPRQRWDYQIGAGMDAWINDAHILVGSESFLRAKGIVGSDPISLGAVDESMVYVAKDQTLLGFIIYSDPLRAESEVLVKALQEQLGMAVHVLTGDSQARAWQVAERLGIPAQQVHAEAFPEDKAKMVRDLRRNGQVVAFVGDGLNDSVALAYADVSISFADGSDIARETADVVLMNNDLSSLLEAIAIARETQSLIEQNTLLVVAPNVIGLGLATTVGLNPLWATLIHNGTAIAAGLNSLRPLALHPFEKKV
jgi:Cu2+-exporting ATPase